LPGHGDTKAIYCTAQKSQAPPFATQKACGHAFNDLAMAVL
jgi:hypothetical protein